MSVSPTSMREASRTWATGEVGPAAAAGVNAVLLVVEVVEEPEALDNPSRGRTTRVFWRATPRSDQHFRRGPRRPVPGTRATAKPLREALRFDRQGVHGAHAALLVEEPVLIGSEEGLHYAVHP